MTWKWAIIYWYNVPGKIAEYGWSNSNSHTFSGHQSTEDVIFFLALYSFISLETIMIDLIQPKYCLRLKKGDVFMIFWIGSCSSLQ